MRDKSRAARLRNAFYSFDEQNVIQYLCFYFTVLLYADVIIVGDGDGGGDKDGGSAATFLQLVKEKCFSFWLDQIHLL